jgi:hypothetical protein
MRCLRITCKGLPIKIVFTKPKLKPPRGGGKYLKGGMGVSPPIITPDVFSRAEKIKPD